MKKRNYLLLAVLLVCLVVTAGMIYRTGSEDSDFIWLIEPRFEDATDFCSGVAWVSEKYKEWKLIDKDGKVLVDGFRASYISPYDKETGLAAFKDGKGWGYVNLSGDIAMAPEYEWADSFENGIAYVKKNGFYGVIDRYGEVLLPIEHRKIPYYNSYMFATEKNGKWGYVTPRGEEITGFIFDTTYALRSSKTYAVVIDKKVGVIDGEGQWILPASYDRVYVYPKDESGLIGVQKDGKVGYVDEKGNTVIDLQFEGIKSEEKGVYVVNFLYGFSEGYAVIEFSDSFSNTKDGNTFGVIDKKGNLLFTLPGVPRSQFREGYMLVQRTSDQRYGLVDRTGKWHPLPSYLGTGLLAGHVSEGTLRIPIRTKNNRYKEDKYGYLKITQGKRI